MLLHVAITNFKKDAQSRFSAFRCIFAHPIRTEDAVTKLLGRRAYGLKKPFDFISPRKGHHGEHAPMQTVVNTRKSERTNITGISSYPRKDNPSRRRPNKHSSLGTTKFEPQSDGSTHGVPSTKWELYQEILRLISLIPPAPFSHLMRVHQCHPALQSVESYNLLLQLSIRHSVSRHTRFLIRSLALNQIEPNQNTEKLVVRHLVTSGHWKQAWQQVVMRYPSVADIPMTVLLELLAPGTRNVVKPKALRSSSRPRSGVALPSDSRSLDGHVGDLGCGVNVLKIPLDTLITILHRFPRLPLDELARLPLRVISYVVRGLIRNGHHDEAIVLTENHLKSLPLGLNARRIDFVRNLVHLHLSSGEVKLANYKKKRRLVERLFSLYPDLSPNSNTVFLLMRYMARSKRCGIEAYLFYKDYRARWGTAVQSQDVRSRIITYAIKQRKLGIAKAMSHEDPLEDSFPVRQEAVRGASDPLWRVRAWRSMYPRMGLASRLRKRLTIRLLGRRRSWQRNVYNIPWPE